jgi:hypothetical protein
VGTVPLEPSNAPNRTSVLPATMSRDTALDWLVELLPDEYTIGVANAIEMGV